MNYYYYFKKNEEHLFIFMALFSMIIVFISAFAYTLTENNVFYFLFALFFSIYCIILILSRSTQKTINKAIIFYSVIGFYFGLLLMWIFDFSFYGFRITDNKMLVFITILYVYLTYNITKSNFEIFQYQKIPQIAIENGGEITDDFYEKFKSYTIKNNGDYPAKNMNISIEILYPVPTKYFPSLFECIKRSFRIGLFSQFNVSKPGYITYWISESIDPNDSILVSIDEKVIIKSLPVLIKKYSGKIIEITFEREVEFCVIIKCEYYSQDGVAIEKPIYKLFTFKGDHEGINYVSKGWITRMVQ